MRSKVKLKIKSTRKTFILFEYRIYNLSIICYRIELVSSAMDEELKCFACKQFYEKPVLLPCGHALCLACALTIQQSVGGNSNSNSNSNGNSEGDSATSSSSSSGDYQESDKLSIQSEADSGVVCNYNSRPNSYVNSSSTNGILFPPTTLFITCPICQKPVYFDENGAHNLPKYRVMQRIIEKYGDAKIDPDSIIYCQMCEESSAKVATVECEQCNVLYCETCREKCHPLRGPYSRHSLILAGKRNSSPTCSEHGGAPLVVHCTPCRLPACSKCLQERHIAHEVQQLSIACKSQKVFTN